MADNDDVFVFGQDGTPVGVNPLATRVPELTDTELHDVAVVASTANELETIALIDMLEETGIPAFKRGGIIHLGSVGPSEIVAPRKLLDLARAAIQEFRNTANERGIENAFSPDSVEEQQNDPRSNDMALMGRIAYATPEEREEILSKFIAQAVIDATPAPELAQHLAAAGLNRDEADALIEKVKTRQMDSIRGKLESRMQTGYLVGGAGAVLFVITLLFSISSGRLVAAPIWGVMATVIGFGLAADAKSKLNALEKK